MTVYRRNPLLMTVMGANPGPRHRRPDVAIDKAISSAWHRLMSGVQVPIMDIPRIFRDIKLEVAAGMPIEQAVLQVGDRYRVNRNPIRPRGYKPFSWDVLERCRTREDARHYITKFDRETILKQLQWNDRNGCWWPDENAIREVGRPTSWTTAVLGMLDVWEGLRPASNPGEDSSCPCGNHCHDDGYVCAKCGYRECGDFIHGRRSPDGKLHPAKHDTPHNSDLCNKCAHEASCRFCRTVRSNPLGEAIIGGVTGALVNRALQSNPGPQFVVVDSETGVVGYKRRATGVGSEAIASCVAAATRLAKRTGYSQIVFLDMGRAYLGAVLNVPIIRHMGITTEVYPDGTQSRGHSSRNNPPRRLASRENPAIERSWDGLRVRPRLAILEFAGVPYEQARRLASRAWGTLPPSIQSEVMKGWQENAPRRSHAPSMNPSPNPGRGGKRRLTMTIERFADWVKSKKNPEMWKAFLAKFKGYEKWTHGSRARKVTVEWVDTPGVDGLWITYDGGKQPESTYIMPKGAKRTGAWKHPWETMPDIKHDPQAGIVLTKLRGQSKITDFYHK